MPDDPMTSAERRTLPGGFSRRRLLTGAGAAGAGLALGGLPGAWAAPAASRDLFTLGVASGDPMPTAVVIWTRLAPEPLTGGGMPRRDVAVQWQVARDERFTRVVREGTATARARNAHSVHVDVRGLEPGREYWYRFRSGSGAAQRTSPVGRTRTSPPWNSSPDRLAFAVASCQQFEHGFFTPYAHMAEEDLDLVLHVGDYIYEYGPDEYVAPQGNVRHHRGAEIRTLGDYRDRHAQYRSDPDLQAAHAAHPWVVVFDDHEIENNWADEIPEEGQPVEPFLRRRRAGMKAYWEHMPLRLWNEPDGTRMRLYRRSWFGQLAVFNVLDTRQYRDDQPCGDGFPADCVERFDRERRLLGQQQQRWLRDNLVRSTRRWNVLAQQVFLAQIDLSTFVPGEETGQGYYVDGWDGYVAERRRLLRLLEQRQVSNPVVLTGDWHANWAADLKADFDDPSSATVGSEFVCTSITSGGDGSPSAPYGEEVLRDNEHIRYFNDQRGYVRCTVTPDRWRTDYRVVPYVQRRGAPVRTAASFVVEDGQPGLVRA